MTRFNKNLKNKSKKTLNYAGGEAYEETPKLELTSIALTSFLKDQFYRSANDTYTKIIELCNTIEDKEFIAKLAVYARNIHGIRTVSHVLAGEIARMVKNEEWTKEFFYHVIHRPDDMAEILAYYLLKYGKPIPNAMKKGFANAFSKFDEYQLAKYRGEGNSIKLIDIANLVHPMPTAKNALALKKLVDGELVSKDTWESELTKAGQKAETENDKLELKANVWINLVKERRIGYFALLRNLRNIIQQCPDIIPDVCDMLMDGDLIRNSMVLPFRYLAALKALSTIDGASRVVKAINVALEISVANVPSLPDTVVVIDKSGSMGHSIDFDSPLNKAALFGAILAKKNDSDIVVFANTAHYLTLNTDDSLLTLTHQIANDPFSGGTNFHSIFRTLTKPYRRIIILSDEQGWVEYNTPTKDLAEYSKKFNCNPYIYSFDLTGYGQLQFPENRVCALAGISEKIFDIMKLVEADKRALIHTIESMSF